MKLKTVYTVELPDAILQSVVATRLLDVEEKLVLKFDNKKGGACAAQMNEWDPHSSKLFNKYFFPFFEVNIFMRSVFLNCKNIWCF